MKMKTILLLVTACAASWLFASADDVRLSFSTPGVDTYRDGETAALDSEFYALVWTRAGATFAGLNADLTPVNPNDTQCFGAEPLAKNGRMTPWMITMKKADFLAGGYDKGTFATILLDTRTPQGTLAAQDTQGQPSLVESWRILTEVQVDASGNTIFVKDYTLGFGASAQTAVPEDALMNPPVITSITPSEGEIDVEVANTKSYLAYALVSSDSIENLQKSPSQEGCGMQGKPNGKLRFKASMGKSQQSRFFKIIRNGEGK